MAIKRVSKARLDVFTSLIKENRYLLTSETHPDKDTPLLDTVLQDAIWNHALVDTNLLPDSISGAIGAWRVSYRVRKKTIPIANNSTGVIAIGPQMGEGSIINPDTPTYFVLLAGDGLDVADAGSEITFPDLTAAPGYPNYLPANHDSERHQLYTDSNTVLIDDAAFNRKSQAFRSQLIPTGRRRSFLLHTSDTEESRNNIDQDLELGPFPIEGDSVDVYVCFPESDVIDYPNWFVHDFEDVGLVEVVDLERMIGGERSTFSLRLHSGGHASFVQLPGFAEFAVAGQDPARDINDPLRDRKIHFNIDPMIDDSKLETVVVGAAAGAGVGLVGAGLPGAVGGAVIGALGGLFFGGSIARHINEVWIDIANELGDIDISFVEKDGFPAVKILLDFETGGPDEIRAEDGIDIDLHKIQVSLFLQLDVREERLYWKTVFDADIGAVLGPVADAVKKGIINSLGGLFEKNTLSFIANTIFSLPLNWEPINLPAPGNANPTADVFVLLSTLLGIKDNNLAGSLLPSNLFYLLDGSYNFSPDRIQDRFVKYKQISLEDDPDVPGEKRLVVDFEEFDAHVNGHDARLDTPVVPLEEYALRPLQLRLTGSHAIKQWSDYREYILPVLMDKLRVAFSVVEVNFLPKLTLEYQVFVEHDLLPQSSLVYEENHQHLLAKVDRSGSMLNETSDIYHFYENTFFPPTFKSVDHLFEIATQRIIDAATGAAPELLNARIKIVGKTKLSYWNVLGGNGCLGAILDIFSSIVIGQARQENPNPSGEAAQPIQNTYERLNSELEEKTIEFGEFELVRSVTGISGLGLAEPAESNLMTASNEHMELDYDLSRLSVNPDLYEWLNIDFTSFQIKTSDQPRETHIKEGAAIPAGTMFDLVAIVDGVPIGRKKYYVGGAGNQTGQRISSGILVPLDGQIWSLSRYYKKDQDDLSLNLRIEAIIDGGDVIAAEKAVLKHDPANAEADWEEKREWEIPLGHASTVIKLKSLNDVLIGKVELQNKVHDPGSVPISHKPKGYQLNFNKIKVHDDEDPLGEGEIRFWAQLDRKSPPDDGFVELEARNTEVREIDSGDVVSASMGPITKSFSPLNTLKVRSQGKDYDSPGFPWYDNHDKLSTSSAEKDIPFDDGADGDFQTNGGNYDLRMDLQTSTLPIAPVLQILHQDSNDNATTVTLDSAKTITFTLRIQSSILTTLTLRLIQADDNGGYFQGEKTTVPLPAPRPLNHYDIAFDDGLSLTYDDGDPNTPEGDPEDFTYYFEMELEVKVNHRLELLATNSLGDTLSTPVHIRIEAG